VRTVFSAIISPWFTNSQNSSNGRLLNLYTERKKSIGIGLLVLSSLLD
jgi:hypothetical protein